MPDNESQSNNFVDWIGIEQIQALDGVSETRLVPQEFMLNIRKAIHGGVVATLLDSSMARAARSSRGVSSLGGTVDLHVQYMQPAIGVLHARGRVESASRSLAFCRGDVRNEAGELVASAIGTFRLRRDTGVPGERKQD